MSSVYFIMHLHVYSSEKQRTITLKWWSNMHLNSEIYDLSYVVLGIMLCHFLNNNPPHFCNVT